jgi:hypothetical protein
LAGVAQQKAGKDAEAKPLYQAGLRDVEESLALDETNAQAHLWYIRICVCRPPPASLNRRYP